MMKTLLVCASLLVTTAGIASAGTGAINLGWQDCGSAAGTLTRTFACASNTGAAHILIGSFVAPPGMLAVSGIAATLDLQTGGATLPAWWQLGAGGCRGTASLVHSFDFTGGPFTCFDYWQGGATGGPNYTAGFNGPNRARMRVQGALPANDSRITSITAGTEVYGFKLTINNAKTAGLGACAGCTDEVCIVHNSSLVTQAPGTVGGNFTISFPGVQNHVIFQAWTTVDPNNQCPAVTPTRNRTWGSIKSIYR